MRRRHACKLCCAEDCVGCDETPSLMRAHITYPPGSGVTVIRDEPVDPEDLPAWLHVTTDCAIERARRFVQRVRITDAGEGYTEAPMLAITGGGGTPSPDAWIEVTASLVSIDVTAPGSGYSKGPVVKFSGGGKVEAVKAQAVLEGEIVSLTLTDPGEGYLEPPEISFPQGTGATAKAEMSGYVLSIAVTDGGSGYTSAPAVSLSGGGGSGATATAAISKSAGVVTNVFIQAKGQDYTAPPAVTFSGGGGENAQANAEIAFTVKSLALLAGGEGYPENPTVRFVGSATQRAAATATIDGKVVAVNVTEPGLYRHRRNAAGQVLIDWPTISIAGSATATLQFSGKVTAIDPGNVSVNTIAFSSADPQNATLLENSNYTSTPDVKITGGGGKGAAAIAEMNWLQKHEQTSSVLSSCRSDPLFSEACFFTESDLFPSFFTSNCVNSAERFQWSVEAITSTDVDAVDTESQGGGLAFSSPPSLLKWFFQGEGPRVIVSRGWRAGASDIGYDNILLSLAASEIEVDYFVARKFSRVPPEFVYSVAFPLQPAEATNVSIEPEWTHYVDAKGDSFWYLESLHVKSAGQNLFIPDGSEIRIAADGNAAHEFRVLEFSIGRQSPAAEIGLVAGFEIQPSVTIALSPFGSPAGTFYRISAATITGGGTAAVDEGPAVVPVILTKGHWAAGPVQLHGEIVNGRLATLELPEASQQVLAGATLTSVAPQDDPLFTNTTRVATGRSPFRVTRSHTAPTVIARAIPPEGGDEAVFDCSLVQQTDLNGDSFWEIASAIATTPGGDFRGVTPTIVFEVQPPGIEAVAPSPRPVLERKVPKIINATPFFGTGVDAVLSVSITQSFGAFGDEYWQVSGVAINNGGLGYQFVPGGDPPFQGEGSLEFTQEVDLGDEFVWEKRPAANYAVNPETGAIVAVSLIEPGWFYATTGGLRRLDFFNKGRFFVREIVVSGDELPDTPCIGPVSKAAGWDQNKILFQVSPFFVPPRTIDDQRIDVGEQYFSIRPDLEPQFHQGNQPYSRVRRCPLPEIEVELE